MYDRLTRKDVEKMQKEVEERKLVVRKQALEDVKEARAQGDLSENFEYKAAKQFKNRNESRIRYLEKMIKTAKESPYFDIINSFYGIGEVLTIELLGELGDITRFDNHRQLIAFCGLDPTIIQSGKSINVHGTISKRGNKYARWILFNISQIVVKLGHQCPGHPVYDYYLTKKAEGKHYYENLTACSTKILRMLYTMCKNNTTFKIN